MATQLEIVRSAEKYIGVKEKPRGSNRTQFGVRYGMNGVAWCAIFQWCVFMDCDINLRKLVTPGFSSCQLGLTAFRYKHWTVPASAAQPGDLLYFQFDRDRAVDHIGLVKSVAGGKLLTIEGNTGHGNDTNGGAVMERTRSWSQVSAVCRVPLLTAGSGTAQQPVQSDPEAFRVEKWQIDPKEDEDEVKNYLYRSSDGGIWLVENGMRRRRVAAPNSVIKLVMLGVANNAVDSKGNVSISTDDEFLSDIPIYA